MMKTNKQNYQMLLFHFNSGLSIEYDEDNNTFQFHKLHVCDDIAKLFAYAYVRINDVILFFGGWNGDSSATSRPVHNSLHSFIAILSEEDNDIHIIGGRNNAHALVLTHIKTTVRAWDPSQLLKRESKLIIEYWIRNSEIKFGWIDDFNKIIINYIKMQ
ncbi:hypothetical protein RFI_39550 [Reticulomyxa filosa]|uniref:Uncharacterized protein n=1 Tax=Reticulomyxa filosa TaxID=46433 RepID=X6L7T6_RETFI|nr:hypothetical protein RFI_39550 [Reticulomyxa filosa]|eukprot:ETN97972.1 hypothetical protein RFI_39550 [Reticulomyxa filosa]